MSNQATLWDTPNATSSRESASGATLSGKPIGPTIDPSGPEAAPAHPSLKRAKARGLMMIVTSGLSGIPSSASAALQSSLESNLMRQLDLAGSTLFVETWKRRTTPLRRRYWEHTASAHPTGDSGCTSVQTPKCPSGGGQPERHTVGGGLRKLEDQVLLATVPTPTAGTPAQNGNSAAGNNDYSRRVVQLASITTPSATDGGRGGTMTEAMSGQSLTQKASLATVATPRSEDSQCAGAHRGSPDTLHSQANLASISTPSARDWKDTSGMSESGVDPDGSTRSRLDQLPRQAQLADSGPTATGGTGAMASTGQLDPAYSRWLQGLPPVFCDCAVMATASLPRVRRSSSKPTSTP